MKTLRLILLFILPLIVRSQNGLSQLPALSGFSILDLRGQTGIAVAM